MNHKLLAGNPVITIEGKPYLRLYHFMRLKHLRSTIRNDELKVCLPQECNDPLEFCSAGEEEQPEQNGLASGFISFCTDCVSSAMWGHYADSHKGICLEFLFPVKEVGIQLPKLNNNKGGSNGARFAILDISHEHEHQYIDTSRASDGSRYCALLLEVNYKNKRPDRELVELEILELDDEMDGIRIDPRYYTKAYSWKYEHEWRMICRIKDLEFYHNGCYYVKGLMQYLNKIILGVKCNRKIETIHAIYRRNNQQMNYDASRIIVKKARYSSKLYNVLI